MKNDAFHKGHIFDFAAGRGGDFNLKPSKTAVRGCLCRQGRKKTWQNAIP
jgi:hypothetical protein